MATRKTRPVADRLWDKVDKTSDPNGCWLWTGARNGGPKGGYGLIWLRNEQDENGVKHQVFGRVHVVAYQILVGPIPEGAVVDHVWRNGCRNRHCCNPGHLEAVTQQVNAQRAQEKNVVFCRKWHPRTAENTVMLASGYRRCLTCIQQTRERARERAREKRREAREQREREARVRGEVTLPVGQVA